MVSISFTKVNFWVFWYQKHRGYNFFYYFQGILLFSMSAYAPLTYNRTYIYPLWAQGIGWMLALVPMSVIPIYFFWYLLTRKGTTLHQVN
jgi:hypothetical protein